MEQGPHVDCIIYLAVYVKVQIQEATQGLQLIPSVTIITLLAVYWKDESMKLVARVRS